MAETSAPAPSPTLAPTSSFAGAAAAPAAPAAEAIAVDPTVTPGGKLYDGKIDPAVNPQVDTKTPEQKAEDAKALEAKAAEDKVAADKKAADDKAAAEAAAAPIKYELKLPEGIKADEKSMATFTALLGEHKIDPKVAQSLVDMHYANMQETAKAFVADNQKLWTETQTKWADEISKDPELGGDKKAATVARLGKALDEYGSPEARQAFDMTGAGNNPHIVRMFNKMAAALEEGGPRIAGSPAGKKGQTLGGRLYPSTN